WSGWSRSMRTLSVRTRASASARAESAPACGRLGLRFGEPLAVILKMPAIVFRRRYRAADNPRWRDVNLRAAPQFLEYEAIVARIAADRPGRILDWGCGWGQVTALLVRAGAGGRVV